MIDLTKTYKTKEGLAARFIAEINSKDYPLIFAIMQSNGKECARTYTANGKYCSEDSESYEDLVEYRPWKDLPIDTPIYVTDDPADKWYPRYFAGLDSNDRVLTFVNGRTSFTKEATGNVFWKYFKMKDEA